MMKDNSALQSEHVNGVVNNYFAVVDRQSNWKLSYPELKVVTAEEYLSDPKCIKVKNAKIINLCKSYRYQSKGYYCSLLAEARKHRIIPSVKTLRDLSSKMIYKLDLDSFDGQVARSIKKSRPDQAADRIKKYIIFGMCDNPSLSHIAEDLFSYFRCPILKVEFKKSNDRWQVDTIRSIALDNLPEEMDELFIASIEKYISRRWSGARTRSNPKYNLAILYNPGEKFPPSNQTALKNFIRTGKSLNMGVELIQKKDFNRLAEYDALFIRETTAIENHTYRFSIKAHNEGMPVIDDPESILKCTNKVFLAELLQSNRIKTPTSFIMIKGRPIKAVESYIDYPIVLKTPDGSNSLGVFRADRRDQLVKIAEKLFNESDIILAQQYMYTECDWRIVVLNGEPIYASQYFMSDSHWQIYNHSSTGKSKSGKTTSVPIEQAPYDVIQTAIKSARLIGNSLYGIDIKETRLGSMVIEINDNPNIDCGEEDTLLKDDLYRIVLKEFIRRIES